MNSPAPRSASHITDHLANERTFLAWVRTALGLIGLGFVLARMGLFLRQLSAASVALGAPALHYRGGQEFMVSGVVFLLIGTAACGWSGWRYDRARRDIDAGKYEAEVTSIVVVTAIVVVGGLALVALVLWRTLGPEGS